MIRVAASLCRAPSGATMLHYDSGPIEREALRATLAEAFSAVCDLTGYTLTEGGAAVMLRVESVAAKPRQEDIHDRPRRV